LQYELTSADEISVALSQVHISDTSVAWNDEAALELELELAELEKELQAVEPQIPGTATASTLELPEVPTHAVVADSKQQQQQRQQPAAAVATPIKREQPLVS
jgi:hypothetical protein